MSDLWTLALMVVLLVVGFGLSIFFAAKPVDWLPRRLVSGAAALFFIGNTIVNAEQRYISLLFALLAAGFLWKSFRPKTVCA